MKTLCLDFDGVIHDYMDGWKDGKIYGKVTPGFFDWLEEAQKHFTIVIYSSRSASAVGRADMAAWMYGEQERWRQETGKGTGFNYGFAHEKPAAYVTIDDRAVRFRGDWEAPDVQIDTLLNFQPWNIGG